VRFVCEKIFHRVPFVPRRIEIVESEVDFTFGAESLESEKKLSAGGTVPCRRYAEIKKNFHYFAVFTGQIYKFAFLLQKKLLCHRY
jgi:hypothetical protein